jgi:DNA repair protein RadC
MYFIKETNWEVRETAQYKLKTKGLHALTDAEILASLAQITQKQARACLAKFLSLQSIARASLAEIRQVSGISEESAMSILCSFEIGRRKQEELSKKTRLQSSEEVANYLRTILVDQHQELFAVLFLNRQGEIIAEEILFKGGVAATIVDAKIIFKAACGHLASAVIIAHNHPSNNRTPSEADKKLTQQLKKAGELLDILVLDHLIVTDEGYFSFADEGLM